MTTTHYDSSGGLKTTLGQNLRSASSPSRANFALQRTADDNSKDFGTKMPEIVKRNFYVDDWIKPVSDDEEGVLV